MISTDFKDIVFQRAGFNLKETINGLDNSSRNLMYVMNSENVSDFQNLLFTSVVNYKLFLNVRMQFGKLTWSISLL